PCMVTWCRWRWIKRDKSVSRCLRRGCPDLNGMRGRLDCGVALVPAQNRINYVEDRDVNNGHGAAGPARTQLFAECAIFAGSNWGVIEAGRVDGDLVPAMHHITGRFWIFVSGRGDLALKLRAVKFAKIAGGTASKGSGADGE